MTDKQTALVVCPGRGTYNKPELGYFTRHHPDKTDLLKRFDTFRTSKGQVEISELDRRERFSMKDFSRGDNASALIYACAYADFLSIDREKFDIIAVTGNSMGWYIATACGGAVSEAGGLEVINTMGTLMHDHLEGGQAIYPLMDEEWHTIPGRREELLGLIDDIHHEQNNRLYVSIDLGGMLVFGGEDKALDLLMEKLPEEQGRFPLRLNNHAAFHTPILQDNSERGKALLSQDLFHRPSLPLIDGRGHIWTPYSSDPIEMWDYTLGAQIVSTYDFTRAVAVGTQEFSPDCIIILGPGTTLGGAVAQSLISIDWQGLSSKDDFVKRQKSDPIIYSMGMDDQRAEVTT